MSEPTDSPIPQIPVPRGPVPQAPSAPAQRQIEIQIDGKTVTVPEGTTILEAARSSASIRPRSAISKISLR